MAKEKEISLDLSKGPEPLPKVGDEINRVLPNGKIISGKVCAVSATGRTVKIKVIIGEGEKAKEQIISLPYRPKEAIAGNTWHWPALVALLALLALMLTRQIAHAALPTYHTFGGATGSSSAPATIILPADPNSQIRIVSMLYTCDNAAGQFTFSSGTTAFSIQYSNTLSTVTNYINSTNGLNVGQWVVLQHNGSDFTNAVQSYGTFPSGTNTFGYVTNQAWIVTSNIFAFGSATFQGTANDEIYIMTNTESWYAGATTNALNGDDIYSGNYGRPVEVQLGPATTITRLNSISSHYDSASQP